MTSRPITKIEKTPGGDYIIEGILDDGTTGADGMRFDPGWLREAAAEWLTSHPNVTMGWFKGAGIGTEVRAEGDKTIIRAKITDIVARAKITAGAVTQMSVGVARPTIQSDPGAPGGVVTGGTLTVGIAEEQAPQARNERQRPHDQESNDSQGYGGTPPDQPKQKNLVNQVDNPASRKIEFQS